MYSWDWKKLEWPSNLIAVVLGEEYLDREQPKDLIPSIHYVISTLPDRVAFVIFQRFKYGKTLQEVAELMGCSSGERARQLQAHGLMMLRHPSRSNYFKFGVSGVQKEAVQKAGATEYTRGYNDGWHDKAKSDSYRAFPDDIRSANLEDVTIDRLDLSVRSYNCLKRSGVATLADILNMTESQLRSVRNLGRKSYDEIIRIVSALGYSLKEDRHESECV